MKYFIAAILIVTFITAGIVTIYGQENPAVEAKVRSELKNKGLSEDEVRQALIANGIDPDNLENATPDQIVMIQGIIEEIATKKATSAPSGPAKATQTTAEPKPTDYEKAEPVEKPVETSEPPKKNVIYGHDFFKIPPLRKAEPLRINENYVIGSGDVISVSIWSTRAQLDKSYTVEKDGYIKFDRVDLKRRVFVRGLTFSVARTKIEQTLSRFMPFGKGEISISLESARGIKISVFGEVEAPGSFNANATNNVFEGVRYAAGVTELASVRNIRLLRANGELHVFDLYKYLADPTKMNQFFLEDNDVIHVPVASRIVKIEGAVRRPFFFELSDDEGISELLSYAGGYAQDAIRNKFQIERFIENKKVILDIELFDAKGKINEFKLNDGDIISVRTITAEANNYYIISGAVYNPGRFENRGGIRISDALDLAGMMPDAKTDFALLMRRNEDGSSSYFNLSIIDILDGRGNVETDIVIENEDRLTIWSRRRYMDEVFIEVTGAVRNTIKTTFFGTERSLKISEAVEMAGGLSRDASGIAFIHRQDPLKAFEKQYIRVDLDKALSDPSSGEDINLMPFDKLVVMSQALFNEETSVGIYGAVNNPGEYQYGSNMSLRDLVTLAGGFRLGASANNIEISRIVIEDNRPTKINVAKVSMDRNLFTASNNHASFILEPYDMVMIRFIPEFEMQNMISISGEVLYPGTYTIASREEKLSDIIARAGGLSPYAFPEGATLFRNENELGFIIMKLEEALKNKNSRHNYIIKNGDILNIPKQKDFVTILGATRVFDVYKDEIALNRSGIHVPYFKGKRAMFYINNYAGGVNENASKKGIFVEHPNGEVKRTINFGLFRVYPKVLKGSIVKVEYQTPKPKDEKEDKEIDWNKLLSDSVAQISTIMMMVVLFRTLSQ
jgi:protein involved in polysaccharide export with SLBB domain